MSFGHIFVSRSAKGYLMRAGLAWIVITPAVAAAKLWWSSVAAAVVGVVGVATYILVATRYMRRRRAQPTS